MAHFIDQLRSAFRQELFPLRGTVGTKKSIQDEDHRSRSGFLDVAREEFHLHLRKELARRQHPRQHIRVRGRPARAFVHLGSIVVSGRIHPARVGWNHGILENDFGTFDSRHLAAPLSTFRKQCDFGANGFSGAGDRAPCSRFDDNGAILIATQQATDRAGIGHIVDR